MKNQKLTQIAVYIIVEFPKKMPTRLLIFPAHKPRKAVVGAVREPPLRELFKAVIRRLGGRVVAASPAEGGKKGDGCGGKGRGATAACGAPPAFFYRKQRTENRYYWINA
ncbi:MAG: hypothetical protein L6277_04335, partial [Desulfobacterales bacterium]|nr:hypothetical protein [Desulfobacterales bacterium]